MTGTPEQRRVIRMYVAMEKAVVGYLEANPDATESEVAAELEAFMASLSDEDFDAAAVVLVAEVIAGRGLS